MKVWRGASRHVPGGRSISPAVPSRHGGAGIKITADSLRVVSYSRGRWGWAGRCKGFVPSGLKTCVTYADAMYFSDVGPQRQPDHEKLFT